MSKVMLALCVASFMFSGATSATAQAGNGPLTPVASTPGDAASRAAREIGTMDTAATYDSRALRIELQWGDLRVVRGARGPVVGNVGLFRSFNVEKLVAGSSQAEAEARLFRGHHRPGAIAGALGALTFGVGLALSTNSSNNGATPIVVIAGLGTMLWGAQRLNGAYAALSRSIWWYNRDLAR